MRLPLQITFRDMKPSANVEDAIRKRATALEKYFDRITSCRAIVEAPHRRRHQGRLYHVRVDLTVPGREVVSRRDPARSGAHEDVYVAIRDAFKSARRALQDHARRARGKVKSHEPAPEARVVRIFPEAGYGFIEAADGREIYFHRNSVLDGFESLEVGTPVRYAEEPADKGPHASTVIIRRRPSPAAPRPARARAAG